MHADDTGFSLRNRGFDVLDVLFLLLDIGEHVVDNTFHLEITMGHFVVPGDGAPHMIIHDGVLIELLGHSLYLLVVCYPLLFYLSLRLNH